MKLQTILACAAQSITATTKTDSQLRHQPTHKNQR